MKILEERIQNYVERFHLQSGMTEWPTVRKVARGLNVGIKTVLKTVEEDYRCDTQGWNYEPVVESELEIYTSTAAIDTAWNKYWGISQVAA